MLGRATGWKQWRGHHHQFLVAIKSEHITYLHALVATLVTRRGIVLDRWSKGLSVRLENIFGCLLIVKPCLILLMEADFNVTNKVRYGIRMLHNTTQIQADAGRGVQQEELTSGWWHSIQNPLLWYSVATLALRWPCICWRWQLLRLDSAPNGFYGISIVWRTHTSHQIHFNNNPEHEILPQDGIWWFYWLRRWE